MCACKSLVSLSLFMAMFSGAVLGQSAVVRDEVAALPASVASSSDAGRFPTWVRYNGTVKLEPGQTQIALTFSIYKDRSTTNALWQETQNVRPDANGNYTVLLGATDPSGLPASVFASSDAQWLGVRVAGQAEGDRALLVSVPYAMNSANAESLQGLPAGDFVLRSELPALVQELKQQYAAPGSTPPAFQPQTQFPGFIVDMQPFHVDDSVPSQLGDLVQNGSGYALRALSDTNTAIFAASRSTTTATN